MRLLFYILLGFVIRLMWWAWTTPKTWTSEPLVSSDYNTYIRDNQNHLKSRLDNNIDYILDEGADYTTTSSSFVDIDGTNLSIDLTTNGGDVLVGFSGSVNNPTGDFTQLTVDVDGSPYFDDDGLIVTSVGSSTSPISFVVLISGS